MPPLHPPPSREPSPRCHGPIRRLIQVLEPEIWPLHNLGECGEQATMLPHLPALFLIPLSSKAQPPQLIAHAPLPLGNELRFSPTLPLKVFSPHGLDLIQHAATPPPHFSACLWLLGIAPPLPPACEKVPPAQLFHSVPRFLWRKSQYESCPKFRCVGGWSTPPRGPGHGLPPLPVGQLRAWLG